MTNPVLEISTRSTATTVPIPSIDLIIWGNGVQLPSRELTDRRGLLETLAAAPHCPSCGNTLAHCWPSIKSDSIRSMSRYVWMNTHTAFRGPRQELRDDDVLLDCWLRVTAAAGCGAVTLLCRTAWDFCRPLLWGELCGELYVLFLFGV